MFPAVALLRCESSCDWMVCPQKLYPHPRSQGTLSKSQLIETDSLPSIFVSVALLPLSKDLENFPSVSSLSHPLLCKTLRSCTRMDKNFLHRHPISTWISLYRWPVRMLNVGKAFASLSFFFLGGKERIFLALLKLT